MSSKYIKGNKARRNDKIMTQIREHCRVNGITRRQLADMTGYDYTSICYWLGGNISPRYWSLLDLVEALGFELTLGTKQNGNQVRIPELQRRDQGENGRASHHHLDQ